MTQDVDSRRLLPLRYLPTQEAYKWSLDPGQTHYRRKLIRFRRSDYGLAERYEGRRCARARGLGGVQHRRLRLELWSSR